MSSTYIETSGSVRVYDSTVTAHDAFPVGTYKVHFSQKDGFSLMKCDDLAVGPERVYGGREKKVEKIFRTYERTVRSLGVMLTGDKGMGKSLFLRMVAERAIEAGIPVVLVTEDADGIVDFIETLDECLVIFDEFEKVFPAGGPRNYQQDRQNQFLTLFDGISTTKRIYCLTVNDIADVSQYIVNRPGRFHYHMRFAYPGPAEVRQFLNDEAPSAAAGEIENAALFSRRMPLNYDHLRAIAFELNHEDAVFADIVEDLNIKSIAPSRYRVDVRFPPEKDNKTPVKVFTDEVELNIHVQGDVTRTVELSNREDSIFISFLPKDLIFEDDGTIFLPVQKATLQNDYEEVPDPLPGSITFTLIGQEMYSFAP